MEQLEKQYKGGVLTYDKSRTAIELTLTFLSSQNGQETSLIIVPDQNIYRWQFYLETYFAPDQVKFLEPFGLAKKQSKQKPRVILTSLQILQDQVFLPVHMQNVILHDVSIKNHYQFLNQIKRKNSWFLSSVSDTQYRSAQISYIKQKPKVGIWEFRNTQNYSVYLSSIYIQNTIPIFLSSQEKEFIKSLKYEKEKKRAQNVQEVIYPIEQDSPECSICLDQQVNTILPCDHQVCLNCVNQFVQQNCPFCRTYFHKCELAVNKYLRSSKLQYVQSTLQNYRKIVIVTDDYSTFKILSQSDIFTHVVEKAHLVEREGIIERVIERNYSNQLHHFRLSEEKCRMLIQCHDLANNLDLCDCDLLVYLDRCNHQRYGQTRDCPTITLETN